jgi:hypothetical protein
MLPDTHTRIGVTVAGCEIRSTMTMESHPKLGHVTVIQQLARFDSRQVVTPQLQLHTKVLVAASLGQTRTHRVSPLSLAQGTELVSPGPKAFQCVAIATSHRT